MEAEKMYSLPKLAYEYSGLEPFMSAEQLTIHHQKHHQAYVNGANAIFEKLEKARKENAENDIKALAKELSFNISGHVLHSMFWENMEPISSGGGEPKGNLGGAISSEYGSLERFKKEFSQAALSVEGSGWAALSFCPITKRLLITQIEKHNINLYAGLPLLLVIDVFEHAYYLDYKNERAKFVEGFWNVISWKAVAERFSHLEAR